MRGLLIGLVVLALSGCVGHGAGAPRGRIVIAAGGTTGVYYGYAKALASALQARDPGLRVDVLATSGSMENLRLVADGGRRSRSPPPTRPPRPRSAGRRSGIGCRSRRWRASTTTTCTSSCPRRAGAFDRPAGRPDGLGRAVGVGHAADRRAPARPAPAGQHDVGLGLDASVAALRAGRISAFFWSGGLPTPGVDNLAHTDRCGCWGSTNDSTTSRPASAPSTAPPPSPAGPTD